MSNRRLTHDIVVVGAHRVVGVGALGSRCW